jgi:hypothetical protein
MLRFEADSHTYYFNEKRIPSVSEIMRPMSKANYDMIPPHILENARARGVRVHEAIEEYEQIGIEPDEEEVKLYFDSYMQVRAKNKFEVVESEIILTNGLFAGTLDQIILSNGVLSINDIKNTSKIHTDMLSVQLYAYQQLAQYNGFDIQECYVTHLTKKRGVMKLIEPNKELFDELWSDWQFKSEFL